MIARLAGLLVAVFVVAGTALSAHPTASTFVVVRVPGDGTVDVMITANAQVLALTLAGLADRRAPVRTDQSHRERIETLQSELLRLSDLEVDGVRLPLTWLGLNDEDERPEAVTIRLTAALPSGASQLRWRGAYLMGAYPLAVVGGAETPPDSYDWLAGREQSRAYALDALGTSEPVWRKGIRLAGTGFTHILPGGLDHVLFVLGLFLLAPNVRTLMVQVSTFTVAHSLTLALGVFGVVRVPTEIVEPLIAASIVFVAIENLVTSSVSRRRVLVVFLFGLLHGLGFAGAMADLGLSGEHLALSLVGFNVGVELGQLAVIAGAALVLRGFRLPAEAERRLIIRPASAAIALTGLCWAIERVM
jgi:hypothetical protein